MDAAWARRLGERLVKQANAGAQTISFQMRRNGPYEEIVVESIFLNGSHRTHCIHEPRDERRDPRRRPVDPNECQEC